MTNIKYSDEQINDFLEQAQEVGITRAMRELGFPSSWATAQRWAKMRGIEVAVDELKAKAAETREWYKEEELKVTAQLGLDRVTHELIHNNDLTPDEQKKLSETYQKYVNTWLLLQGKATSINENKQSDSMDQHLQELLNMEKAKNQLKKEAVT